MPLSTLQIKFSASLKELLGFIERYMYLHNAVFVSKDVYDLYSCKSAIKYSLYVLIKEHDNNSNIF